MLNQITLMGRMTRAPELRRTSSGKPVCNFTLAVDRDFDKDTADFITCVAWNKTAEYVNNYGAKGRLVTVSGTLRIQEWEYNGQRKHAPEVVVQGIYFCEKSEKPQVEESEKPQEEVEYVDDFDEELPF